ncbi:MAG: dolichyl-phosphate beta-glucosyltransferase [Acidobacteriota bacterium]
MSAAPHLSLVIPAYNEGERLPETLPQVVDWVRAQSFACEVLLVNNNSRDRTREIGLAVAVEHPFLRVIDEPRQGKGAAVRTGVLQSLGEFVFVADADFSMPIEEIAKFLPPQASAYDVAIGSREAPGAHRFEEPAYRHLMGRVFNLLVKVLAVPGLQDTQCGFKCFRREAALDLFRSQTDEGWAFDVEILFIARHRGYRIIEIPIDWYYRANSRVSPITDSIRMAWEVLGVRCKGMLGRYGPRRRAARA